MKKDFYETEKLPTDYLFFKRLTPIVTNRECKDLSIVSHLEEEANVDMLSHPIASFKFEETFHTMLGNRFHIYHNDEFVINKANLVYYRLPKYVKFDRRNLNKTLEFKKDVCEMIIDEAVKILASDIESVNQKTLAQERVESNN